MEGDTDALEQYTRISSARISGIEEGRNENTDQINPTDIDRSHRAGKLSHAGSRARHRDITVKLATYKERQKLFLKRKEMHYKKT